MRPKSVDVLVAMDGFMILVVCKFNILESPNYASSLSPDECQSPCGGSTCQYLNAAGCRSP